MKISCRYCGIVDKPHICTRRKRTRDRTRKDNKVYDSKEYRKARKKVLETYNGICLWSLYVDGQIVKADVTHHIVEVLDDITKGKSYDNLIPLSNKSHDIVHRLYKINKEAIQNILYSMIEDYKIGDFKLKKYRDEVAAMERNLYPHH